MPKWNAYITVTKSYVVPVDAPTAMDAFDAAQDTAFHRWVEVFSEEQVDKVEEVHS